MSEGGGGIYVTLYGLSIMKEPLENALSGVCCQGKARAQPDIHFIFIIRRSETVTNQILQGVKAQVAILSMNAMQID